MTSVTGHNVHECPSCKGELSVPNYSSCKVNLLGQPLSWVKCSHCINIFELNKNTQVGYLPPPSPIPLDHGGFDLVGETFEEKMLDLHHQTEAYHASNGSNVNRPPTAAFVTPPKAD